MREVFISAMIGILILMHLTFVVAVLKKRNDLADIAWGPGFLLVATIAVNHNKLPLSPHSSMVLYMVSAWCFRLLHHVGLRVIRSEKEDQRYFQMRQGWGRSWVLQSYFKVFLLQGFLMFIISTPLILIFSRAMPNTLGWISYLGGTIWFIGFILEGVSDNQLKSFKAREENSGKIMTSGLWAWSRHPNYFGEALEWWGIFIMALPISWGWVTLVSPLLLTFLLLKVSGIPLLEELMKGRPGFAEYKATTPIFIPRPPRRRVATELKL